MTLRPSAKAWTPPPGFGGSEGLAAAAASQPVPTAAAVFRLPPSSAAHGGAGSQPYYQPLRAPAPPGGDDDSLDGEEEEEEEDDGGDAAAGYDDPNDPNLYDDEAARQQHEAMMMSDPVYQQHMMSYYEQQEIEHQRQYYLQQLELIQANPGQAPILDPGFVKVGGGSDGPPTGAPPTPAPSQGTVPRGGGGGGGGGGRGGRPPVGTPQPHGGGSSGGQTPHLGSVAGPTPGATYHHHHSAHGGGGNSHASSPPPPPPPPPGGFVGGFAHHNANASSVDAAGGGAVATAALFAHLEEKKRAEQGRIQLCFEALADTFLGGQLPSGIMPVLRQLTTSSLPHIRVEQRLGTRRGDPSTAIAQFVAIPVVPNYRPTQFNELALGDSAEYHVELALVLRQFASVSAVRINFGPTWKAYGIVYCFVSCKDFQSEIARLSDTARNMALASSASASASASAATATAAQPDAAASAALIPLPPPGPTWPPPIPPNMRAEVRFADEVNKDVTKLLFAIKELLPLRNATYLQACAAREPCLFFLYDAAAKIFRDLRNYQMVIVDLDGFETPLGPSSSVTGGQHGASESGGSIPIPHRRCHSRYLIRTTKAEVSRHTASGGVRVGGRLGLWEALPDVDATTGMPIALPPVVATEMAIRSEKPPSASRSAAPGDVTATRERRRDGGSNEPSSITEIEAAASGSQRTHPAGTEEPRPAPPPSEATVGATAVALAAADGSANICSAVLPAALLGASMGILVASALFVWLLGRRSK